MDQNKFALHKMVATCKAMVHLFYNQCVYSQGVYKTLFSSPVKENLWHKDTSHSYIPEQWDNHTDSGNNISFAHLHSQGQEKLTIQDSLKSPLWIEGD